MSSLSSPSSADMEPGQLLSELEQRQDDVLAQLDELDAKLIEVLQGLGATMDDDANVNAKATIFAASESDPPEESAESYSDDPEFDDPEADEPEASLSDSDDMPLAA